MKTEIAGITRANEGMQGISWNILGQTYVPKSLTEHSFSWHATFPPDTFVPPRHPSGSGRVPSTSWKATSTSSSTAPRPQASPGDLVRLPMGKPHGIFNKSGRTSKVLFWVSPTRRLYDLFWNIHNLKEQTPDAVVALAGRAQRALPATASGRVRLSCPAKAGHPVRRGLSMSITDVSGILDRPPSRATTVWRVASTRTLPNRAPVTVPQSPPSRHTPARSLRAGCSSAPSRYP